MKSLYETLLDADSDLNDSQILRNELCEWLEVSKDVSWKIASKKFEKIMSMYGTEKSPMKRTSDAENYTVITLAVNGPNMAKLSILRRGKDPAYSYIEYKWLGNNFAFASKGWANLLDAKNLRPGPTRHNWVVPFKDFDALYDATPCAGNRRR